MVDKTNDKVKFDSIPKTIEEYISVTFGCKRFIDSYRFLSRSSDSLVKILPDNRHKTLNYMKKEIADNDEILKTVNGIVEEDKTIEDINQDSLDKVEQLEET